MGRIVLKHIIIRSISYRVVLDRHDLPALYNGGFKTVQFRPVPAFWVGREEERGERESVEKTAPPTHTSKRQHQVLLSLSPLKFFRTPSSLSSLPSLETPFKELLSEA